MRDGPVIDPPGRPVAIWRFGHIATGRSGSADIRKGGTSGGMVLEPARSQPSQPGGLGPIFGAFSILIILFFRAVSGPRREEEVEEKL